MKVGDLVMFFNNQSIYAKWFFGKLGIVETYSENDRGRYCRVKWISPVKYFSGFATISDFSADDFEVCYADR